MQRNLFRPYLFIASSSSSIVENLNYTVQDYCHQINDQYFPLVHRTMSYAHRMSMHCRYFVVVMCLIAAAVIIPAAVWFDYLKLHRLVYEHYRMGARNRRASSENVNMCYRASNNLHRPFHSNPVFGVHSLELDCSVSTR